MAFMDDLKQGLGDVTRVVCEKSGQFIEIQKLRMKKSSVNSDLRAAYMEIGKMIYEEKNAGAEFSGPVVQLCKKVDAGQETIKELDKEIEEIKAKAQVEDTEFEDTDIVEDDVRDVTVEEDIVDAPVSEEPAEEPAEKAAEKTVEEPVSEAEASEPLEEAEKSEEEKNEKTE